MRFGSVYIPNSDSHLRKVDIQIPSDTAGLQETRCHSA